MSIPPEKNFPKEVREELQNLGASIISKVLVAFKKGDEPTEQKLQELELVFDCESNGRMWYEYKPATDE